MARVKLIVNKEDIAPEHHALFDKLAALRGRISGPSTVVLHSPGLARPWNEISEYLHRESIVEPEHAELAVCATAREKDCGYVWKLLQDNRVESGVFDQLLRAHDPQWLVELTSWIGRYAALSGILNAFEVTPGAPVDALPAVPRSAAASTKARPPLAVPRITPITRRDQVPEEHRSIFDAVAEGRGSVRGPFSILMHSPELC